MGDDSAERRSKRQKRESSYREKAFEKFKQLKSGVRNKYEVEELENVYDVVDDKEYTKKVLARQDDDWIVDDGSGYVEDGREIFDDDLDHESIAAAAASNGKGKGVKRKKKGVAENAGKGNLQYLLSNMPVKKKEEVKLEDEALSEILGEIDETPTRISLKPKLVSVKSSPISVKQQKNEYVKSFTPRRKPVEKEVDRPMKLEVPEVLKMDESAEENSTVDLATVAEIPESKLDQTLPEEANATVDDCFNDDLDLSQIDFEEKPAEKKDICWENIEKSFLKDAQLLESCEELLNDVDIPLTDIDEKTVFRFFWWDAFEDPIKQPGVVLLFGKTFHQELKAFVSCCVAVRNIERRLFFLPKQKEEETGNSITAQDVYKEVNDSVMKELGVKQFKARPISKKYAFDPEIPLESDYVEVHYSAKESALPKSAKGKTFSKVFGTDSSFLEMLLLDRKIKGPCWLEVANPVHEKNPVTLCKLEITCNTPSNIAVSQEALAKPPPLVVSAINLRTVTNVKNRNKEIVMISCLTNVSYCVDKQTPSTPFQDHFCVFTCPSGQMFPVDFYPAMVNYKATTLHKVDSEKALLNLFINQFEKLDCDLVVGHDLQGYQILLLSQKLVLHQVKTFNKLGRIRRTVPPKFLDRSLFVGRLVCDVKTSAKELIKCRSYDLDTLCQFVLKMREDLRVDMESEQVYKMYQTSPDIFRLITLTMQDTASILKIMYNLNIIPLVLQITNIAGNVMSRTLMGGRSERNEFLLLHAFSEKGYIVPDKHQVDRKAVQAKKAPTYSGGLVLDPKVGLYNKLVLLMDFNSLYPSIIQEYNLCFTTTSPDLSEEHMVLPDRSLPPGILPTEIRKLVESRREVKKLMNNPDLSSDMRMQYHIRQMALKLTANSMYGCLGFSNSRFYAKNLAALTTYKGREILMNTKELVERMNYEVIYGDTDSLMINTNIVDYDQVFQIGIKIKQEVNKLYKQVELDIDGVFKYLLLLKKKKYAAVTLTRDKDGNLHTETEYKGLDIVRRDWSKLAANAGRFALAEILSEKPFLDKFNNILAHLQHLRETLEANRVPLPLLVITKQLTKNPHQYPARNALSHVLVALRYNHESGGHFRAGDVVPYLICEDNTANAATQRAYHVEELSKNSDLRVDVKYYLSQQIYPVVKRICEPIPDLDLSQIAAILGVDVPVSNQSQNAELEPIASQPLLNFKDVDKFAFECAVCGFENTVEAGFVDNVSVLELCQNVKCTARPVDYLARIQCQIVETIDKYIDKYYAYELYCEDPGCVFEGKRVPQKFAGRFPVCPSCKSAVLLQKYTALSLFSQLYFFTHIFDLEKLDNKPIMEAQVVRAHQEIKNTVNKRLLRSQFAMIKLNAMYSPLLLKQPVMETETTSMRE